MYVNLAAPRGSDAALALLTLECFTEHPVIRALQGGVALHEVNGPRFTCRLSVYRVTCRLSVYRVPGASLTAQQLLKKSLLSDLSGPRPEEEFLYHHSVFRFSEEVPSPPPFTTEVGLTPPTAHKVLLSPRARQPLWVLTLVYNSLRS